jgi:hypothetical protein
MTGAVEKMGSCLQRLLALRAYVVISLADAVEVCFQADTLSGMKLGKGITNSSWEGLLFFRNGGRPPPQDSIWTTFTNGGCDSFTMEEGQHSLQFRLQNVAIT